MSLNIDLNWDVVVADFMSIGSEFHAIAIFFVNDCCEMIDVNIIIIIQNCLYVTGRGIYHVKALVDCTGSRIGVHYPTIKCNSNQIQCQSMKYYDIYYMQYLYT